MNSMDMLDIIGEARGQYIMEAQAHREGKIKRRPSHARLILIAAALALLLMGCAWAVMKLQDLKITEYTPAFSAGAEGPRDVISLQGFAGTPGYLAAGEWNEFAAGAETDRDFEPPDAYSAYNCRSQEMADKAEALCEKYGLQPLGMPWFADSVKHTIFPALGIEGIHSQNNGAETYLFSGTCYGDGSFFTSGETVLAGEVIGYQFNCCKKQSFHSSLLNIGRIEDFRQWEYVMADGTPVLLALSGDRALILADRGDSFLTVHVPDPGDMDEEMLEAFAETFDFTFRTGKTVLTARETPDGKQRARYHAIVGTDPFQHRDCRIFANGRVYTCLGPYSLSDYTESRSLGALTFDRAFPREELVTDCPDLKGYEAAHLTGGLTGDALLVSKTGALPLLFAPRDVFFSSEYDYAVNEDGSVTILKYRGTDANAVIPSEIGGKPVESISGPGEGAFSNCPHVVSVTVPAGVRVINDNTFYGAYGLEKVELPAGLEGIGHCAFNLCPSLKEVRFGGDAPVLGNFVFDHPTEGTASVRDVAIFHPREAQGWEEPAWEIYELQGY